MYTPLRTRRRIRKIRRGGGWELDSLGPCPRRNRLASERLDELWRGAPENEKDSKRGRPRKSCSNPGQ